MKKLIIVLALTLSESCLAEFAEKHFARETEKACSKEVLTLGCGVPTEKNAEAFLDCVDQKIDLLSKDCQEFHLNIRNSRSHKH